MTSTTATAPPPVAGTVFHFPHQPTAAPAEVPAAAAAAAPLAIGASQFPQEDKQLRFPVFSASYDLAPADDPDVSTCVVELRAVARDVSLACNRPAECVEVLLVNGTSSRKRASLSVSDDVGTLFIDTAAHCDLQIATAQAHFLNQFSAVLRECLPRAKKSTVFVTVIVGSNPKRRVYEWQISSQ